MPEKSVIIIGGGVAGFAAGIFGRMNGYSTRILEHDAAPGGVAKAWKHGDYLIDGGIHYLMGHHPGQSCYELYREVGVLRNRTYPDLTNYVQFADEISGAKVNFTRDLDQLARDLKAVAPEDARFIDGFIAGARSFQRTDVFSLMEVAPELLGPIGWLKHLWKLRRAIRYMGGPYHKTMREFAKQARSPILQRMLTHLYLPDVPAWFNLLIFSLLANGQLGLLAGSCADFMRALVERHEELGGQLTCDATVKEVIVENGRAVGVRLEDGTEHRADDIVSAGDGRNTVYKLLGGRYLDRKTRDAYENWKQLPPLVTLNFGVTREYTEIPPLHFLYLKEPLKVGNRTVEGFPLRFFNYGPFAPPGKSVVQVLLLTDWEFWDEIRHDRPRYEAAKKQLCDDTLNRLEAHYPGLTAKVELTDIATPYTTWRYTLNHRGAAMGWMPTPHAIRTPLPKTLPGLSNFYMAGQWVMPGGGIPPSMYSGRHVIQMLCKRDGKRFVTTKV